MVGLIEARWYYFQVTSSGLRLVPDWWFPPRPADAQPSNGNPHTPWHLEVSHVDATHAHIFASSEAEARLEAHKLYAATQDAGESVVS